MAEMNDDAIGQVKLRIQRRKQEQARLVRKTEILTDRVSCIQDEVSWLEDYLSSIERPAPEREAEKS